MANNLVNVNPNFFEGVEKLLEIWFEPSANADLRKIPRYIKLHYKSKEKLFFSAK